MDTSLERIQAKIAELETRLANLRIAERELRALEAPSATKVKALKENVVKSTSPAVSEPAEEPASRSTIGAAIAEVLQQHGALSAAAIAEQIVATGRDINNRAVSFALQALKKKGLVKSAGGEWSLGKARAKRGG